MSSGATSPKRSRNRPSERTQNEVAQVAGEKLTLAGQHFVVEPARNIFGVLREYADDKPDVAAMWCFGLGLIVGWKLRG